ncbi:biotin/lipoate A/B protein ligase family protein [Dongia sp.]|uniref:lipoate--protein ligase family protein n=1 Tax=Dongia sp. TaxID=1977262 RepID=UPI0037534AF1
MNLEIRRGLPGASAESDIAGEMQLLEDVLEHPERGVLRLWRTSPCLVVTPLLAQRPAFAAAAEASAQRGWPVVVRRTGGGPVPQTAGTLNVSLAYATPRDQAPTIDAAFQPFAEAMLAALQRCGVAAQVGEIEGSCCPGRYDIAIGRRKIIGIAQRRRQGTTGGSRDGQLLSAVLVHAMVWIDGTLDPEIDRLEQFLEAAGAPAKFRRDVMGTLQGISGVSADAFEAASRQVEFARGQ